MLTEPTVDTSAIEAEIDRLVYELYGWRRRKLRLWRVGSRTKFDAHKLINLYLASTSGIILALTPLQTLNTIEGVHQVMKSDESQSMLVETILKTTWRIGIPRVWLKEYLASCLLQRWQIPTPEIAFVWVKPEHIPERYQRTVKAHFLDKPCFGSKYYDQSIEVNQSLVALGNDAAEVRKIQNRLDLLRIGLFDLWLANDDRKQGNYNLRLNPTNPVNFTSMPLIIRLASIMGVSVNTRLTSWLHRKAYWLPMYAGCSMQGVQSYTSKLTLYYNGFLQT